MRKNLRKLKCETSWNLLNSEMHAYNKSIIKFIYIDDEKQLSSLPKKKEKQLSIN